MLKIKIDITMQTLGTFNFSVHKPVLSLHSKELSISPISTFRSKSVILNNLEVRNTRSKVVKITKKIKFNLLYDKYQSLQKK